MSQGLIGAIIPGLFVFLYPESALLMVFSPDSLLSPALLHAMPDGAGLYMETHPGRWPVEPWNALTSLVMMVPALIWFFRLRKEWKRYRFLLWCIPWLVLGSLGSALFHAFRSSQVFLLMDVLPMAVLTLSVSIYFWVQVLPSWWMVFLVLVPSFLLRFWMFEFLPMQAAINLSYLLTGVLIFLPLLIILVRTRFLAWTDLLLSAASLSLALLFRKMDSWNIPQLPMGTHFLWHLLSAPGAWFLAKYLYRYRNRAEDA